MLARPACCGDSDSRVAAMNGPPRAPSPRSTRAGASVVTSTESDGATGTAVRVRVTVASSQLSGLSVSHSR